MINLKTLLIASLAMVLGAARLHAQNMPLVIAVAPGETPRSAAIHARERARAAALRRAWLAGGHALPEATEYPAILSGEIRTPSINVDKPPATPAVSVRYKTGPSGLDSIDFYFYSNTTGQSRYFYYGTEYYAPASTHGSVTIEAEYSAFDLYTASGDWTLGAAYVYDKAGNATEYDSGQLAALFPSLTVNVTSRFADTVSPTISAAKLLTPTVSQSSANPSFGATLTVSDGGSGAYYAYVYIQAPGYTGGYTSDSAVPAPARSATIASYSSVLNYPTGTWTIYSYEACDAAGNCTYDSTPADIKALFGTTTFTVTK